MGACVGTETGTSPQQITTQIKRLKHEINYKIQKIRNEAIASETILVTEFKKAKPFRAAAAEMALANEITMKQNKIQIYEIIRGHMQKLIDYNHHLTNTDNAKQSLYPSFRIILYSQSIIKDQSINSLCQAIKERYPDIGEAND